ncbi:MAG: hypothetical protein Ta2E_12660 [Mycoplasmoidaceae bacterium]|nr:MAG: hypothetical protein Ta2E_12660 [Mycoplasmoidaceae bacterium]
MDIERYLLIFLNPDGHGFRGIAEMVNHWSPIDKTRVLMESERM